MLSISIGVEPRDTLTRALAVTGVAAVCDAACSR